MAPIKYSTCLKSLVRASSWFLQLRSFSILTFSIVCPCLINAQNNIVLNPDFELHKSCKLYSGSIHAKEDSSVVNNWVAGNVIGTSDYYNSCSEEPVWYNIPLSALNYQLDYNIKNGYALIGVTGLSKFNNNKSLKDAREYIETKLKTKMNRQKYV